MLTSDALKAHFEDNPRDLAALRHDKPIVPSQVQVVAVTCVSARFLHGHWVQVLSHLAHVPEYLVPMSLQAAASAAGGGLNTDSKASKKRNRPAVTSSDPLKSFAYNAHRLGGAIGGAKVRLVSRQTLLLLSVECLLLLAFQVTGTYAPVGVSTSGRRQWQIRHKRGNWNPKNRKGKSGK